MFAAVVVEMVMEKKMKVKVMVIYHVDGQGRDDKYAVAGGNDVASRGASLAVALAGWWLCPRRFDGSEVGFRSSCTPSSGPGSMRWLFRRAAPFFKESVQQPECPKQTSLHVQIVAFDFKTSQSPKP